MSETDRRHWDERYRKDGLAPVFDEPPLTPVLARLSHLVPAEGQALELACGRGRGAVWLAKRGLDYFGVDVSPVAIDLARELARRSGVGDKCRFEVHDLDHGLPESPQMDLIFCHLFRDPRLDQAIVDRLSPGGLLVIVTLSEVGAEPGRYRVPPGELTEGFGSLGVLEEGEEDGMAWLAARKPG